MDETPEEICSAITEVMDHKVLGETPEAVRPCLEEYEQDKGTLMPRRKNHAQHVKTASFSALPSIVELAH